jgi:hypothetical protein
MKHLKLFESNKSNWREEAFRIYDMFCELEDKKICTVDLTIGYMNSNTNCSYPCFIQDNEIGGGEDVIDISVGVHSRLVIRALHPNYLNKAYSPFKTSNSASIFGENVPIFLEIMKSIDLIKNRLPEYQVGITLTDNYDWGLIYINFLKEK